MTEFHTRVLTPSNATVVRTGPPGADADLSDEEFLQRYPRVAEILARWELEETD
ncbi:hypothetical protein HYE82_03495 [Streptomyces sp. BR123]|uniref:hypothetical protein n=1 Tax=Streptomyces sp. BR123 TaxID=2749828 RepID=UPI0015C4E00B|nr:hypothetical protein [Streptomyces sp. BR123]NXY93486.1 hypothetical protein [Streptomyces sp. BR123]